MINILIISSCYSFKIWKVAISYYKYWQLSSSCQSPWNKTGSCGITAMAERRLNKLISEMFIPATVIFPSSSSVRRNIAVINELFPAPVLPTTPILEPLVMFMPMFFNTSGPSLWYLSWTFWNCTSPFLGHVSFGSFDLIYSSSPLSSCSMSCNIWFDI